MKPCIRCLSTSIKRMRSGVNRIACTIQCIPCGFNTTSDDFDKAEERWDGFAVWKIIDVDFPFLEKTISEMKKALEESRCECSSTTYKCLRCRTLEKYGNG